MSADTLHYIDLSPEKCISIHNRHILIKKYKSDESYYQGRPINQIESVLVNLIVEYAAELAALRARCERAEAELNTIREKIDPLEGQTLIEAIDYLLLDDSSAEIYRAELANVTAERDAFAAESEAVHRAINEMCGTADTSTIEAVQKVTAERDVMAIALRGETKLIARLTELTTERDAARDALKVYERQKALRQ